ncbi:BACON domain-containing protein [Sphingobacterium gobiense]|uniref:BACON domain-containing protein n=1 Tax=Sphingobacterium gobiense TaxID=1382456 RepID=A0A2S9JID3_9SPHI|nr:BACON domain-containing protein [Sphingobacterium gobiense]PRD52770.1 hypothetical protein C5749_16275 [Sphingobacterium gobiense]
MKLHWTTFFLTFVTLFVACKKDNDDEGYFELQDNVDLYEPLPQGATETYSLRADGYWQVEPLYNENWLKIEPMFGNGDGSILITVDRNSTLEDRREVLMFLMNGRRQEHILEIVQAASENGVGNEEQYMRVDGLPDKEVLISEEGISGRYTVRATGTWRIELSEEADWISVEPMMGTGDTPVELSIAANRDDERSVDLNFYLDEVLQPNPLRVLQEGMAVQVILEEDFNWLQYGSAIFYTNTDETRLDRWTSDELARGWGYHQLDPTGVPSTYARQGFLKLGRTNYGGDILSPKLSAIQGTQNVKVTFKAVPYKTAGGAEDVTLLKVGVAGPGVVSVDEFDINNWPDYDVDPNCTIIWTEERTARSFTIEGATAETQIWFLGGDYDLRSESGWSGARNVNRIFLDDVLVTVLK